jgi:hypothetical protein
MPVYTDPCQPFYRPCERQALGRADTHQHIASGLVDDLTIDHRHHHAYRAELLDRQPAEVLSEDDEVGRLADLEAAFEAFLRRGKGPWTLNPLPIRRPLGKPAIYQGVFLYPLGWRGVVLGRLSPLAGTITGTGIEGLMLASLSHEKLYERPAHSRRPG